MANLIRAAKENEALTLNSFNFGELAVEMVWINDEPLFYAPSLARTLEHKDARDMLRGVPDRYKGPRKVRTLGGVQEAAFLTEVGFYRVVFKSQSPKAEPFLQWVTEKVLPSLRKTGQYSMHQTANKYGIKLNLTEAQWDWLRERPSFVDVIPLALAGYNSVQITKMLGLKTPSGITARKQIEKLKELGILPLVIEPRAKQLEARIKAEAAAAKREVLA